MIRAGHEAGCVRLLENDLLREVVQVLWGRCTEGVVCKVLNRVDNHRTGGGNTLGHKDNTSFTFGNVTGFFGSEGEVRRPDEESAVELGCTFCRVETGRGARDNCVALGRPPFLVFTYVLAAGQIGTGGIDVVRQNVGPSLHEFFGNCSPDIAASVHLPCGRRRGTEGRSDEKG